jgi:hypothetical protein
MSVTYHWLQLLRTEGEKKESDSLSNMGKNINDECLKTECLGRYLDIRRMK